MMLSLSKFTLPLLLSIIFVSYTEKSQVTFLMPIRDAYYLHINKGSLVVDSAHENTKISSVGPYLNPWEMLREPYELSQELLLSNCSYAVQKRNRLLNMFRDIIEHGAYEEYDGVKTLSLKYNIPYSYGLEPGWISAMVQARLLALIKVITVCYPELPNISRLEKQFEHVKATLKLGTDSGGVLVKLQNGIWLEEYAQPGVTPPLVLNGHIYALQALQLIQDYDVEIKNLVQLAILGLKEQLPKYDIFLWSMYDQAGTPANRIYQQALHVRQLKELYISTGDTYYQTYYERFKYQYYNPFSSLLRMYLYPSRFLGILLFLNYLAFFMLISLTWKSK